MTSLSCLLLDLTTSFLALALFHPPCYLLTSFNPFHCLLALSPPGIVPVSLPSLHAFQSPCLSLDPRVAPAISLPSDLFLEWSWIGPEKKSRRLSPTYGPPNKHVQIPISSGEVGAMLGSPSSHQVVWRACNLACDKAIVNLSSRFFFFFIYINLHKKKRDKQKKYVIYTVKRHLIIK